MQKFIIRSWNFSWWSSKPILTKCQTYLTNGFSVPLWNQSLTQGITLLQLGVFLSRGFHSLNYSIKVYILQHAIYRKNHKMRKNIWKTKEPQYFSYGFLIKHARILEYKLTVWSYKCFHIKEFFSLTIHKLSSWSK